MKHTKFQKAMRFALAGVLAGTMALASVPMSAAAVTNSNSFTDVGTLQSGLKAGETAITAAYKGGAAFNPISTGANSYFILDNMDFNPAIFSDYIQFEIKNTSASAVELAAPGFQNSNGNAMLDSNSPYELYDFSSKTWTGGTTNDEPALTIPAGFNGMLRFSLESFYTKNDNKALYEYLFRDRICGFYAMLVRTGSITINKVVFVNKEIITEGAFTQVSSGMTAGFVNGNGTPADISTNIATGNPSKGAQYLQFKVDNASAVPLQMIWFKVHSSAGGYTLQPVAGAQYFYKQIGTDEWQNATVKASSAFDPSSPCLEVPAKFSGYIRLPIASLTGGVAANDTYVIHDNLIVNIDMYVHTPGAVNVNMRVGNFCWVYNTDSVYCADGDVNGDAKTDIADMVRAKKVVAGNLNAAFRATGLDNGDSVYDAADIVALKRILLLG